MADHEPFASLTSLQAQLAQLDLQHARRRRRCVETPCTPEVRVLGEHRLAFASNDYLGLANDPRLVAAVATKAAHWGVGAGASHLVSGHLALHEALESRLAAFVGCDRALYFSSGYMANTGIIPAMLGRGDAVFADRLNHASLVDGALLSRAELHRYPHNDLATLDTLLKRHPGRNRLIATDAVFSMDGDIAPLPDLLALARRHQAWLLVDDAHGFGVLGPQGRGSVVHFGLADERILYMGTLGKAAGVGGAFVAGHAIVVEWLLQKARTYTFTTASSPLLAGALLASIDAIEDGDDLRARLFALIRQFRAELDLKRWRLSPSKTPIQPVVIGSNAEALAVSAALDREGLWVPAIRPPTVPQGSARLRVSLTAAHTPEQVSRLAGALNRLERELPRKP